MDPNRAKRRLNTALWRLRQAVDGEDHERGGVFESDRSVVLTDSCGTILLDSDRVSIDADPLIRLQCETPASLTSVPCSSLEAAVRIEPSDLFMGCYHDIVVQARERMRAIHTRVLFHLCVSNLRAGDLLTTVHWARQLLDLDPYREDVHRLLIRTLRTLGRPQDARAQLDCCLGVLRDELGVEPQPETLAALHEVCPAPGASLFAEASPPAVGDDPVAQVSRLLTDAVTMFTTVVAQVQATLEGTRNQ